MCSQTFIEPRQLNFTKRKIKPFVQIQLFVFQHIYGTIVCKGMWVIMTLLTCVVSGVRVWTNLWACLQPVVIWLLAFVALPNLLFTVYRRFLSVQLPAIQPVAGVMNRSRYHSFMLTYRPEKRRPWCSSLHLRNRANRLILTMLNYS